MPRATLMAGDSGSAPWKTSATKSSTICCRSRADNVASLCISCASFIVLPRLAIVLSTARRSRSVRISASSAVTCVAATSLSVLARDRTAATTSRPRPSSRRVLIRSSLATAAAS